MPHLRMVFPGPVIIIQKSLMANKNWTEMGYLREPDVFQSTKVFPAIHQSVSEYLPLVLQLFVKNKIRRLKYCLHG